VELAQAEADHVNVGTNPYKVKVVEETVARLREKVRHKRSEAERYRRLVGARSASPQEYETVETQLRQAEVELREQEAELVYLRKVVTPEQRAMLATKVQHARAALELAEERLRETRLVAPFDGTVLKLLKREGEGTSALLPDPVVLFGDLSRLRVRAEIDERFVQHLAVGQTAVIYGRNLAGKSYRGQVVQLEPLMGDKTVFTRASSERKDLNVLQVLLDLGPDFRAPVGLQVDVKIESQGSTPPASDRES
jgi:HlyD family secretion protein